MKKGFRISIGDKAFDVIVYFIAIFCTFICFYPLYLVVINSFSDPYAVALGEVFLVPKGLTLAGYIKAFENKNILSGYANSIFYTVVGTTLNMLLTIPAAYALSKQKLKGRSIFMMMIIITMYFSGGLVPHYLLLRNLNLLNTRTVVLVNAAVASTNLIIARTFFASSVPRELEEAAEIDGCSIFQTFVRIVLPLSKAMLGVILLYYAVGRWNNFASSFYYQPMASEKHSLQMVIRDIVNAVRTYETDDPELATYYANLYNQIKYAIIVIASLPLMIVYPFLQKYFDKGVMLGSVKG